jgi:DNA-binding protein HU-beta
MNKTELAQSLAGRTDLTQAAATEIVESIFASESGIIASELGAGREVTISGFGKFETRQRAAREGRNPRSGAAIQIAAKTIPSFKAAKGLRDRVG